jgi:hypothetical protein
MYDREKIRELIGRCKANYTLPQAFYPDANVFAFDMAKVFTNSWRGRKRPYRGTPRIS